MDQCSNLEKAIHSLVGMFHRASCGRDTITLNQLRSLLSSQGYHQAVDGDKLQQVGLHRGQDISFDHFWKLISQEILQHFQSTMNENKSLCGCQLQ